MRQEEVKREESLENYLKTILMLEGRLGMVRSIDIVNEMGFSKPSISIAMKNLREKKLIEMDPKGYIHLTEDGRKWAESVTDRQNILTKALMYLGVPEDVAHADACRMEHDISEQSFQILKAHVLKHIE